MTTLDDIPVDLPTSVRLQPPQLDSLLGPLIVPGTVTLLHGSHRAPLTTLAHEVAVGSLRHGGNAVYLDSGTNFKPTLAKKMCRPDDEGSLKRLMVAHVMGLEELQEMVSAVVSRFKVIVVDSLTGVLNLHGAPGTKRRQRHLFTALEDLRMVILDTDTHLLLTDHSSRDPSTGTSRPVGGNVLQHAIDTMIRVEPLTTESDTIRLQVERSPFLFSAEGLIVKMDDSGVKSLRR